MTGAFLLLIERKLINKPLNEHIKDTLNSRMKLVTKSFQNMTFLSNSYLL